jgi:hypothetical protein
MGIELSDDAKRQYCRDRGVVPEHHCCLSMSYAIAHPVEISHQGPNRVVDWIASWNEYLIPVSHDGYAATLMKFCPWCGQQLSESKQKLWYQSLYKLGFLDPGNDEIPTEFQSDRWWREDAT